uniref:Chemosensory protein n=1 Tax=Blattella germanica TaxID=6973 RepID=A0A0X8DBJ0_BLAGE|nr:chemosensory protein [Blattella germanica]
MNMRNQIVIVLLSFYGYALCASKQGGLPKKVIEECRKATGVTEAEAQELQENDLVKDESNEAHRCFVACILSKRGAMKDGKMVVEEAVHAAKDGFKEAGFPFDEAKYRKGLEECNKQTGEGKCVKSYNAWKCFLSFTSKTMIKSAEDKGK